MKRIIIVLIYFILVFISTIKAQIGGNVGSNNKKDSDQNLRLITMIEVQGGTFQMGSNTGESNENPIHSVTVSDFYIGKTEVTQYQWKAVMGSYDIRYKGDSYPDEYVDWIGALMFCNKLSEMEGLEKCYTGIGYYDSIKCNFNANGYRLPTEAEWEYAARGGNQSRNYKYSGSDNKDDVAWDVINSFFMNLQSHPVGKKQSNELGIYDMSGNVWEWCWDGYGLYSIVSETNPTGPCISSNRVLRGGSWFTGDSRVTNRTGHFPNNTNRDNGFRVARTK